MQVSYTLSYDPSIKNFISVAHKLVLLHFYHVLLAVCVLSNYIKRRFNRASEKHNSSVFDTIKTDGDTWLLLRKINNSSSIVSNGVQIRIVMHPRRPRGR